MNNDFQLSGGQQFEKSIAVVFELVASFDVAKQCRPHDLDALGGESAVFSV